MAFKRRIVPLSLPIFYAEPQHKRISSSIGAKLEGSFLKEGAKWQRSKGTEVFSQSCRPEERRITLEARQRLAIVGSEFIVWSFVQDDKIVVKP